MKLNKRNLQEQNDHIYDAVVVGGGAGGLSAGIYLQRYLLNTLIIDKGKARSLWMQELHNYLGLPPDTPGRELLKQGKEHYLSLNGDWLNAFVEDVTDAGDYFIVRVKIGRSNSVYHSFKTRYLVAASGVIDHLPQLENMQNVFDYAGYNLHVCLICDGYEVVDQRVGIFGASEASLGVAEPLSWFTRDIVLLTNGQFEVSPERKKSLADQGFELVETPIKQFLGENHQMTGVELENGSTVQLQAGLVSMGSRYHSDYLSGIDLDYKGGNLITDDMLRTSHPRIFAIGDLKVGMNQVIVAASDGAKAATQIWRDIRRVEGSRRAGKAIAA
ncbi:NAD(P)/FAD-dependent oxidoreductase [Leptothoe sp. LEGE 181152]|nr:NAD(P)/FAD-dependent oxidoreductase [Leptothoe sp. LEGE 181152]